MRRFAVSFALAGLALATPGRAESPADAAAFAASGSSVAASGVSALAAPGLSSDFTVIPIGEEDSKRRRSGRGFGPASDTVSMPVPPTLVLLAAGAGLLGLRRRVVG